MFTTDLLREKADPAPNIGVVHSLDDLVYVYVFYDTREVKEGLLKDYMVADILLLAAFDEPITKLYVVTLAEKARLPISGVFKKTAASDEECGKLLSHLVGLTPYMLVPDSTQEAAYWQAVSCGKAQGYLESADVTDLLKFFYKDNKALIKEIRRQYKL